MAPMNPCCCCKLQTGTTIVAIFNMVCSVIGLVWYLIYLLVGVGSALFILEEQKRTGKRYEAKHGQVFEISTAGEDHQSNAETTAYAIFGLLMLVITIIVVVCFLITFVGSVILLVGARKRAASKCKFWFVMTIIFLVFYCVFKIIGMGFVIWSGSQHPQGLGIVVVFVIKELIGIVFAVLIEGYQLWVVYAFMDEVKRDESRGESAFIPDATVHYAPKPVAGYAYVYEDNPPSYPQAVYAPYQPTGHSQFGFPTQPVPYPVLPSQMDNVPNKNLT